MPCCDCGFDFVKARIKRRPLVSYTLIAHKSYKAAIRREHAIIVERDAEKKHTMIADAATSVGTLTRCPDCGAWLLDEPSRKKQTGYSLLRNAGHQRCLAEKKLRAIGGQRFPH